jgi:hypothetical protein
MRSIGACGEAERRGKQRSRDVKDDGQELEVSLGDAPGEEKIRGKGRKRREEVKVKVRGEG